MATVKRKSFRILAVCTAVLVIGMMAALLMRKPPVRYQVTFLPSLGGFRTEPYNINDHGRVVGMAETPAGSSYVFVWDKEQGFRSLERFDDPLHTGGLYINNAGQIIGTMADPNGNQRGFLLEPDGSRRLLGALGGKQSEADGLNDKGQVVGSAEMPARNRHAFVWEASHGMRDLGTLGGLISNATSINNAGQVFGFAEAADRRPHAVVWDPIVPGEGQEISADTGSDAPSVDSRSFPEESSSRRPSGYRMIDLGYAGIGPLAGEINDRGLVVRRFGTTSGKTYFMTWTQATGSKTLDFVIDSAWPCGLNEKNQFLIRARATGWQMFGRVFNRRYQAYFWDPNEGPLLLESYLPVKDIRHFTVKELNNRGQIVAVLQKKDSGQVRAIVLERIEDEKAGR
jgi:probable HAF family extracellular repeat protein